LIEAFFFLTERGGSKSGWRQHKEAESSQE